MPEMNEFGQFPAIDGVDETTDDATAEAVDESAPEANEESAPEPEADEPVVDDEPVVSDDPFAWVKEKGVDPAKVRKTFEKFTTEHQAVLDKETALANKEASLAPLESLRAALENDAGLVRAVEDYFNQPENQPSAEDKVAKVEERLNQIQVRAQVETEIAELRTELKGTELPDFDDTELVGFAAEKGSRSLKDAYTLMKHEEIVAAKEAAAFQSIKDNAKKKVTTVSGTPDPTKPLTAYDLESMTDEEFKAHMASKK